jgi:predicted RNase H-like HicB family nuclease
MLEYHAAYHYQEDTGWYVVRVLDFPGALSQGRTLKSARKMIRNAIRLMAECLLERGQPLPLPNPRAKEKTAFLVEPVRVGLRIHAGTAR